jgi:demethylmenaquinone methyltransferase/2-methoxy-6-polyprenyl-1,4-benzoquinol methylase
MNSSTLPSSAEKAAYVNRMFAGIAHRYDLVNRLMTGGQDVGWRREVVALCRLPAGGRLLDVGTGTGDIAYEAKRTHQDAEVIGCDFTFEMMAVGRQKGAKRSLRLGGGERTERVEFVQGDGLRLPFADGYFDAVTSGFLLRNVTDVDRCLAEQRRVTKPGGRIVCLETSPPPPTLIAPLLRFYMLSVIPVMGQMFATGNGTSGKSIRPPDSAYRYLPQSTVAFLQPEEMALQMERAGFRHVFYRTKMLGTVAIHVGAA